MSSISARLSMDDYFRMGYTYQAAGDLQSAAECYLKSIERQPSPEAHTFLGWVLAQMGEFDAAILECERAVALDPDFGNAWNDMGAYLIEKRQIHKAIDCLKKAVQSKNYDSRSFPHFNLARAYIHEGLLLSSEKELEKALEINSDFKPAQELIKTLRNQIH